MFLSFLFFFYVIPPSVFTVAICSGGEGSKRETQQEEISTYENERETGAGETSEWDRAGPVAAANLLAGH